MKLTVVSSTCAISRNALVKPKTPIIFNNGASFNSIILFLIVIIFVLPIKLTGQQLFQKHEKVDSQLYDTLWLSQPNLISRNGNSEPCYILYSRNAKTNAHPINAHPELLFKDVSGTVSYEYLYRSRVDIPFEQDDFQQHTIRTKFNIHLLNRYPVAINMAYRASNSPYFRNYLDINVGFDPNAFRKNLTSSLADKIKERLSSKFRLPKLEDAYNQKVAEALEWKMNYSNPEFIELQERHLQTVSKTMLTKVAGLNAMLDRSTLEDLITQYLREKLSEKDFQSKIKEMAGLSDSTVLAVIDESKGDFEDLKEKSQRPQAAARQVRLLHDSIMKVKAFILDSVSKVKSEIASLQTGKDFKKWFRANGHQKDSLPGNNFLMSVTSLNVGRTIVNYSYLTVSNISVTGIDAELKPGPSLKFSAGTIDYRFRDFISRGAHRPKQTIIIGRVGFTDKTGSGIFFTSYSGRRDIVSGSNSSTNKLFALGGFAIEGKWYLSASNVFSLEMAKSTNPAFRAPIQNSKQLSGLINFGQRSNEGYALQYMGNIKLTSTRLNLNYRKFGPDFQSFSIYAFNANQNSWSATVDQDFFRKKLSLKLGIRKNEFVYPSITDLSSNSVFKTAQLSFHKRKWPTVVAGYYPATQVVVMPDKQLSAVTYHTLSWTTSHQYNLFGLQSSSMLLYSRFYNTSADSSFIYYNASYLGLQQLLWFGNFTLQAGYTLSEQQYTRLATVEGSLAWRSRKGLQLGGGLKGNTLTDNELAITGNFNFSCPLKNIGTIQARYDKSYLPAWQQRELVPVSSGQIIFTRNF